MKCRRFFVDHNEKSKTNTVFSCKLLTGYMIFLLTKMPGAGNAWMWAIWIEFYKNCQQTEALSTATPHNFPPISFPRCFCLQPTSIQRMGGCRLSDSNFIYDKYTVFLWAIGRCGLSAGAGNVPENTVISFCCLKLNGILCFL